MKINCAGFLDRSRVNGPGERAVLWVQGCPLHCPGCFNRSLWSFKKTHLISAEDVAETIISLPGIDGITFSGGEPFCQALPLAEVGNLIRREGLSVVTFSGFPAEVLFSSGRSAWRELIRVTDLLVAGPYIRDAPCGTSLCGSRNQEILHLSTRIPRTAYPERDARSVEFTINRHGEITTTGFPEMSFFYQKEECG